MFGLRLDSDFSRHFLISLGGHALVVILSLLGGQIILKFFTSDDIEVIRSSVRVDVVGMPKFTIQELKTMHLEPTQLDPEVAKGSETETKKETEDVINKDDLVIQEKAKVKNSFLNLLSDYSSKKVAPKARKKGADTGSKSKDMDTLIIEGNRLSKGSALVGDYSDKENSEFASYVQIIPEQVRKFWKLPSYLLNQDLRCRIRIYLSPNGDILKLEVQESSGQPEYDARAEKAIRDAAPFPKASEAVGERLTNSGIILGFPL